MQRRLTLVRRQRSWTAKQRWPGLSALTRKRSSPSWPVSAWLAHFRPFIVRNEDSCSEGLVPLTGSSSTSQAYSIAIVRNRTNSAVSVADSPLEHDHHAF